MKSTVIISIIGLISFSTFARRGKFKQVKVSACEGKQVGNSCTFEGRDPGVIMGHGPNHKKGRRGPRS